MLNLQLKKEIRDYARENPNEEICGLITISNSIYKFNKCRNVSFYKKNECILSALDYLFASKEGQIVACVHSQPSDETSIKDNFTALMQNICSIVYCLESDKFYIIEPKLKDYLDKDFKRGSYDCLGLVINYFKDKHDIIISNYDRDDEWFNSNPRVIWENFKKEGFIEVEKEDARKNDVLLFGKNKEEIYHIGVYLGDNLILHHPNDGKSCIEEIHRLWKNRITLVLRHKSLL